VTLPNVVLGKQVMRVGHGLELQRIARIVSEKHGPLLARLTCTSHADVVIGEGAAVYWTEEFAISLWLNYLLGNTSGEQFERC